MRSTTQFPASISPSELSGANGFAIPTVLGVSQGSSNGIGDINNDGVVDFVLSPSANGNVFYVVFGKKRIGSSGFFDVSTLNGVNGFIVTGFPITIQPWSASGLGDINGDDIADFAVEVQPYGTNGIALCYVIFGKSGIGNSGSFDVNLLNGNNGFVISGLSGSGQGGLITKLGDINNDGINDLVIGAPSYPACYVVFGKFGARSSSILNVANLNGSNGFNITGYPLRLFGGGGSISAGYSVSGGDINADGIADLMIGAPVYDSSSSQLGVLAGIIYVIFGQAGIGNSGSMNVMTLNGGNGFTITGFAERCGAGYSVTSNSDFNNDGIADLIIGAPYFYNGQGKVYVVYGKSGIGSSGTLDISTLTSANGFVLMGPLLNSDNLGSSVSGMRDVNGDGIDDLVIGGGILSYVVFGNHLGVGSAGILSVSNLNGVNGFEITAGEFVSGIGDINDDGMPDFMIANSIIFGDSPIQIIQNNLTIQKGRTQLISSLFLNATSLARPALNPSLVYSIINPQHGYFKQISAGLAATSFTQQQIQSGQIQFVHDDSGYAPSYSISVTDGGFMTLLVPQPAQITFVHLGPYLNRNTLSLNQGQTIIMSNAQLSAISLDNPADNPNLIFTVSNITHGQFNFYYAQGVSITSFTQLQILTNSVQFVSDGSIYSPQYAVSVSDGGIITSPQSCVVYFNRPPVLGNNTLTINQGQSVVLSSINLSATDPNNPASGLLFLVSDVQHGLFEFVSNLGSVITSFTQAQLQSGDVQFTPDGTINIPSYSVAVTDGLAVTTSLACLVSFNIAPILVNNYLRIAQGKSIVLSTANLSATDPDDSADNLNFIISQLQHGSFELSSNPGVPITHFTLAQVQAGVVRFIDDGSAVQPHYFVEVSDGKITTIAEASDITFNAAPVIISNYLTINQGQTVILTGGDLSAQDPEVPASDLIFTVSNVQNGYFEDGSNLGIPLSQFSQQRILAGELRFVADGSPLQPNYNVSVSDGSLSSALSSVIVNFTPTLLNTENNSTIHNLIIGGAISGSIALLFLALKIFLTYKANQSMQNALKNDSSEVEKQQIKFTQKIIRPLTQNIFNQIKTTSILGYRSEEDTNSYIAAIEHLVSHLADVGIELDVERLSSLKQTRLFNEIIRQIRLIVIPTHPCCSMSYLFSFFKPEATPTQIEIKASAIAQAVAEALANRHAEVKTEKTEGKIIDTTENMTLLEKHRRSRLQTIEHRVVEQAKFTKQIQTQVRQLSL